MFSFEILSKSKGQDAINIPLTPSQNSHTKLDIPRPPATVNHGHQHKLDKAKYQNLDLIGILSRSQV